MKVHSQSSAAVRVLVLALAVAALAACGATRRTSTTADSEVTRVQVENRGWVDMTIYAVQGGSVRRRLGEASATGTSTFVIPEDIVSGGREIQFLMDPIGGRGNATTRRIYVTPGQTVVLQISP